MDHLFLKFFGSRFACRQKQSVEVFELIRGELGDDQDETGWKMQRARNETGPDLDLRRRLGRSTAGCVIAHADADD